MKSKSKYSATINVNEARITKLLDKVNVLISKEKNVRNAHTRAGMIKHIRRKLHIANVYMARSENLRRLRNSARENLLETDTYDNDI